MVQTDAGRLPMSSHVIIQDHLHFVDDETEAKEVKSPVQGHALAGNTFVICIQLFST